MLSLLRQYLQHEVLFNEGELIATFKNNFGSKLVNIKVHYRRMPLREDWDSFAFQP